MKQIYLDYAATTPTDPEVFEKMKFFFENDSQDFGNPSSLHYFGQRAQGALDFSRQKIAQTIGANFREIIFTSSATEANNLIIRGVIDAVENNFKNSARNILPKIIVSSVEHPSVLETVKGLESRKMAEAAYLPVDKNGLVDLSVLEKELNENVVLVSVMAVNNEIGTVEPIEKIAKLIGDYRKSKQDNKEIKYPLFHCDATQAFNLFDLNVIKSGVDLMTFSSHKIYGPKGAAAAYIKGGADKAYFIKPITTGGGQEYGLRAGTENIPAIVGFAYAAEKSFMLFKKEKERLDKISKSFIEEVKKEFPEAEINGFSENKSPHIVNLYFPHNKNIGISLDLMGISASAGSACAQRIEKPSHVLKAMGFSDDRISQSIRFSFGRFFSQDDIRQSVEKISQALKNKKNN